MGRYISLKTRCHDPFRVIQGGDTDMTKSGLAGISVSRLDTMISSGLTGIDMIRSGLAGVSVSKLDTMIRSELTGIDIIMSGLAGILV